MRKLIFYGAVCLVACSLFLVPCMLNAQVFGGNPSSVKWKQISTDTARIIFPTGLDSQAKRIASIVHYLQQEKPVSLGDKHKKINIVLQNATIIPNAYVGLGPYRSEFFMTANAGNFDQGSIAWPDLLALHEYRHVQQFNNFKQGLSKFMYRIAGDDGLSLAINAAIPDWFYEGDAVYSETVLSAQGRGRLPLFTNAYPSLWQAGKKYSWAKLRNGSMKDYVPNHYYLGYLLVNYGRQQYGADFWTKVTKDASAFKSLFYPFQSAVKKHAGIDFKTFRNEAFRFYKNTLRQAQGDKQEDFLFPVKRNYVTSYYFPYSAGADSLIYLKTSLRHRPAFYIKDAGGEHRLKARDISIDEQFSYRNGKIVYAAYETDPRWGWRDYSVIRILDIKTGQQHKLTQKSKYFTPDISADGSKVAAVQNSDNGQSELHVLDAVSGQQLQSIRSSEISLFTDPKFIDDNTLVTAVRLRDGKMALASAEISSGNTMRLTTPSYNVLGYPCVSNGIIYFTATYNGNDDVFALRMSDKKIFQVSSGPLGKYFVNAANGKITWSAFTAEGYQLKQVNENPEEWTELGAAAQEVLSSKISVATPGDNILLSKVGQRDFAVKDYKKSSNPINIHSWRPYYEDPIFTYTLYGRNILNTTQTDLYYLYNQNEKTSAIGANAVYGATFPFIDIGTEYTFDVVQQVTPALSRTYNQLNTHAGLIVLLNPVSGQTYKNFSIGSYYVLRNEFNRGMNKDTAGNNNFSYLQHFITWSQRVQQAVQHIYPRSGYSLSLTYRHAVTKFEGNHFIGSGTVYAPGVISNHSIVLSGSFQERDTLNQVGFSNRFAYSRGYSGRYFSRMWRLSANYHFPLWHMDWGFGDILYIQRVRANAFYDFTKVYSRNKLLTADQRSFGGEIFFDTKWWNQYPLTFGFRVSKLLDRDQFDGYKGMRYEIVMPVNIIPR